MVEVVAVGIVARDCAKALRVDSRGVVSRRNGGSLDVVGVVEHRASNLPDLVCRLASVTWSELSKLSSGASDRTSKMTGTVVCRAVPSPITPSRAAIMSVISARVHARSGANRTVSPWTMKLL